MIAHRGRFAPILLFFFALTLLALALPASAGPLVFVNGRYVNIPAVSAGGRTYVPAREVVARLNAALVAPSARELTVVRDGRTVARVAVGVRTAIVNGRPVLLDGAPFRRGSRSFVPVGLIRDALGARVRRTADPPAIRIDGPAAITVTPAFRQAPNPQTVTAAANDTGRAGPATLWPWIALGVLLLGLVLATIRRTLRPRLLQRVFPGFSVSRLASLFRKRPVEDADAFGDELFTDAGSVGSRIVTDGNTPRTLQLRAEELKVEKTTFARGEAHVRIEVITEQQTVTVPLMREELVIEFSGQSGAVTVDGRALQSGEIVRIPLREERVDITKYTIVKEDVVIGKRSIEEQRHFQETLRREELRVDEPAQANISPLGS
ncbi:MAG: hypothetical protein NVSMB64_25330 [Candidatus Velthaea sp.]